MEAAARAGAAGARASAASAGIGRLFNDQMGGQISWLLPVAAVALVAGLWTRRGRPRTDRRRAAYLLWGGWALTHALVFSYMTGIVHAYYTVAMAPAVGALVGMGALDMWAMRARPATRWVLPAAIAATGIWAYALLSRTPDFAPGLRWIALLGALAAAAALLVDDARLSRRATVAAVAVAIAALLAGPAAYALDTVGSSHAGGNPLAGPAVAGGFGGPGGMRGGAGGVGPPPNGATIPGGGRGGTMPGGDRNGMTPGSGTTPGEGTGGTMPGGGAGPGGGAESANATLVDYLLANRGSARWIAATSGSNSAGPLQLAADAPVMAMGGFSGGDPAPSLEQFIAYVRSGELRYYVAGGMGGGGMGGSGDGQSIQSWAEQNGTEVNSSLVGGATVYDLSDAATATSSTS